MTQVGHILTGIAIGTVFIPEKKEPRWRFIFFFIFSLLALIPDFRIKYWGHHRYFISHSIFINMIGILVVTLFLFSQKELFTKLGGWKVLLGGSLAWVSHLLLDTFYNHGKGLAMFWPFSDARLALPISWFSVVKNLPRPITWELIRILLIELAFYGTLLLVVIILKRTKIMQRIALRIF
ncbi:MAG: hypothetical protein HN390_14850 [Anaerolineae bacterium]|jgi:hypothetical protein|nr:hypothetical protein [Anaerolineae bacterium]MBT7192153.1 hypothetical protein [Anaerolineae bacterium]MBT7991285.1 hypothetical protein [Anaerolineae bacterium]